MDLISLPRVRFADLPEAFKSHRTELAGTGVEFKGLQVTEIKADRAKRRVELWIAGFGNVDLGADLILRGAAEQTIKEDLPRGLVKFFWNHQEPLGPCEALEEHKDGLFMVGKVTDHPDFDKRLAQIEDKTAAHGSLGLSVRESVKLSSVDLAREFGVEAGPHAFVRVIKRMRVWEGSAVIWPMNELVKVVQVRKGAGMEKGLKFQIEHKGLYELSDVIYCLARIRSLTTADWAALTEGEAEAAAQLIEEMTSTEKSITAGIASRETKTVETPAPVPASPVAGGETAAVDFKALLELANSRTRALQTPTE